MSVLVCVALTVYLFTAGKRAGVMETVGIALIVAGGLGNALDRFTLLRGRFHRHGVYQLPLRSALPTSGLPAGSCCSSRGCSYSRKDAPAKEVASEEK
ncbi:MAG: signal peptidase II [Coriobacteriaceae bacterium]